MRERPSEQFLGMLESLRLPTRFQQGRRYLRAGRVRTLTISTSLATGLVRAYTPGQWQRIEHALANQAIHTAKLLAGTFPDDLDELLETIGLNLFPQHLTDIALECTCTSWQHPCAHAAATCYALAASFDEDPFGILAWRGRSRDDLLTRLRTLRATPDTTTDAPTDEPRTGGFWTAGPRLGPPPPAVPGTVRRPDALLEHLDPLGLTAGRFDVTDLLRGAYKDLTD
jgi:uncharacterized Zn finger protein